MELWLAKSEIPLLKANEDEVEYFRNESNFEIYISFIIDPLATQPYNLIWVLHILDLFYSNPNSLRSISRRSTKM